MRHWRPAEIWVAQGTYTPNYDAAGNPNPADPRTRTFALYNGVQVYGGFMGTETALSERTAGFPTILSGDFNADDVVSGSGATLSITGNGENAYRVVTPQPGAVLDRLTISGGNGGTRRGGGVYLEMGVTTTLTDCVLTANVAHTAAGVFVHEGANLTMTGCVLVRNRAATAGGAGARWHWRPLTRQLRPLPTACCWKTTPRRAALFTCIPAIRKPSLGRS